jgi:hypothetical protein
MTALLIMSIIPSYSWDAAKIRGSSNVTAATATSLVLFKPTGTAEGDIMLASLYKEEGSAPTVPAGWDLIAEISPAPDHFNYVYLKRAGRFEPATYTWSFASAWRAGLIAAYSGTSELRDVQDAVASANSATSGQTLTFNSINTQNAESMIIALGTHWVATVGTWSSGSSMNSRVNGTHVCLFDIISGTAAPTGNKTASTTSSSESWTAVLIALRDGATDRRRVGHGFRR